MKFVEVIDYILIYIARDITVEQSVVNLSNSVIQQEFWKMSLELLVQLSCYNMRVFLKVHHKNIIYLDVF